MIAMDLQTLLVYSDETLIAVNKPAGLRVIPDGYDPSLPNLAAMLRAAYTNVWVVHRLDKDTSGIVLFALSAEAHRSLNQQFERRETQKEYHAIVIGMPEFTSMVVNLPLRVDGDRRHRTIVDHQTGKPAETALEVSQPLGAFTLLNAYPHTGYTHQIRAHLAAVDLPILADPLYKSLQAETQITRRAGEIARQLPIQRTALHASRITLQHPQTQQPLALSAPYPDDFAQTLTMLIDPYPPEEL